MNYYYYDCEFLEGTQKKKTWGITYRETKPTIDLISIGIVAEDGREYYSISKDFNLDEAWNRWQLKKGHYILPKYVKEIDKEYWIRDNVLKPIYEELLVKELKEYSSAYIKVSVDAYSFSNNYNELKRLINKYGKTNKQIAEEVKNFVNGVGEDISVGHGDKVLYGYYSAYDHVVLCQLFGKMINLPKGFPMYTKDLKQELDRLVNNVNVLQLNSKGIGVKGDIKDLSFESKLRAVKAFGDYPKQIGEHNALEDALWNRELHRFIKDNSITYNVVNVNKHVNQYISMVEEFHNNFEAPVLAFEEMITDKRAELRINLILEELHELAVALDVETHFRNRLSDILSKPKVDSLDPSFRDVLDALADLKYVLNGTILEVGAKDIFHDAFIEVHSSNMTKVVSSQEELNKELELFEARRLPVTVVKNKAENYYFKGEDGKIIKPSTYRKVDLNKVITDFIKKMPRLS